MRDGHVILVVNRNRRNLELLLQFLGGQGYQVLTAVTLEEFDRVLDNVDRSVDSVQDLDLALVDIAGFDRQVWERCESLRDRNVSLLVVSPRQSSDIEKESLAHGARGVLTKPLVVRDLLALIANLLEG